MLFLLLAACDESSVTTIEEEDVVVTRYDCDEDWDWQYTATGAEAIAPVGIVRDIPADANWVAHTGWYHYSTPDSSPEIVLDDYHYTVVDSAGIHVLIGEEGSPFPYQPPTDLSHPMEGDDVCYIEVRTQPS